MIQQCFLSENKSGYMPLTRFFNFTNSHIRELAHYQQIQDHLLPHKVLVFKCRGQTGSSECGGAAYLSPALFNREFAPLNQALFTCCAACFSNAHATFQKSYHLAFNNVVMIQHKYSDDHSLFFSVVSAAKSARL